MKSGFKRSRFLLTKICSKKDEQKLTFLQFRRRLVLSLTARAAVAAIRARAATIFVAGFRSLSALTIRTGVFHDYPIAANGLRRLLFVFKRTTFVVAARAARRFG